LGARMEERVELSGRCILETGQAHFGQGLSATYKLQAQSCNGAHLLWKCSLTAQGITITTENHTARKSALNKAFSSLSKIQTREDGGGEKKRKWTDVEQPPNDCTGDLLVVSRADWKNTGDDNDDNHTDDDDDDEEPATRTMWSKEGVPQMLDNEGKSAPNCPSFGGIMSQTPGQPPPPLMQVRKIAKTRPPKHLCENPVCTNPEGRWTRSCYNLCGHCRGRLRVSCSVCGKQTHSKRGVHTACWSAALAKRNGLDEPFLVVG